MYNFIIFMFFAIFVFNCSLIVGLFIIFKLWGYRAHRITLKNTCLASRHKQLTAHDFSSIEEISTTHAIVKKEIFNAADEPITLLAPFLNVKPLSIGHFIARGIYCQRNHKQ